MLFQVLCLSNFKLALTQYTCCLFTYSNKASLSELWMVFTMDSEAPFHLVFVEVTVSKQKLQCLKNIWWWQLQLYTTIQHTTPLTALTIFNLSPMQNPAFWPTVIKHTRVIWSYSSTIVTNTFAVQTLLIFEKRILSTLIVLTNLPPSPLLSIVLPRPCAGPCWPIFPVVLPRPCWTSL